MLCPQELEGTERVMSTLNLALQNVSLAQEAMDPELELKIKNKTSLTELRKAIKESPHIASGYMLSMNAVISRLCTDEAEGRAHSNC